MNAFMGKLMGPGMVYKIEFKLKNEHLIIYETGEVLVNKVWTKILWKMTGVYYMFKQSKIHKQVKKELEKL